MNREYKTILPGVYRLALPACNPFPKAAKWLCNLPVFPAGNYLAYTTGRGLTSICKRGEPGFVTSVNRTAFAALAGKLVFIGPLPEKTPRADRRKHQPAFDLENFLQSLSGRELRISDVAGAAKASGISNRKFYGELLAVIKPRLTWNEFSERWTYVKP